MKSWLHDNAAAIQAAGALVSALVAVAAFAAIFWQVTEAARLSREQSARDIYREFLNLSIQNSDFSAPDGCALANSSRAAAYRDYVDYMLYASEQALAAAEADWRPVVEELLERHSVAICAVDDAELYTPQVETLLEAFRADRCPSVAPCN